MRGLLLRGAFGGVAVAVAALWGLGCSQTQESAGREVKPLRASEVSLVVSRVEAAPRRLTTSSGTLRLPVYFDPEILRVSDVAQYVLWVRDGAEPTWHRAATASPSELPFEFEGAEGVHGFRVSVVLTGGSDLFVPGPTDEPLVWVHIDQTAPTVRWLGPPDTAGVVPGSSAELKWMLEEDRWGKGPVRVEWSGDGGATWSEILTERAETGPGSRRWTIPKEVTGELLVRVRAWDLVGLEGSSTLRLRTRSEAGEDGGGDEDTGATLASEDARGAPGGSGPQGEDGGPDAGPDARAGEGAAGEEVGEVVPAAGNEGEGDSETDGAAVTELAVVVPLSLEADCIRGGVPHRVLWDIPTAPADPTGAVMLEVSTDGGATWTHGEEGVLGEGGVEWVPPEVTAGECRLRLVVPLEASTETIEWPDTLHIDSAFPELTPRLDRELVSSPLSFPLSILDEGCADPERVFAFLRAEGEAFWTELPEESVELRDGTILLDLGGLAETRYELYLGARDAVGNESPAPGPATTPQVRFELDRTPPEIALKPPVFPWVRGLEGSIEVDLDPADSVAPLVLDVRTPGGEWTELKRFATLTAVEGYVDFPVPGDAEELEIKVTIEDKAGNEGVATVGPRKTEQALELMSFRAGRDQVAGATEVIAWNVHPMVQGAGEEYQIAASHRRGSDDWEELFVADISARRRDWRIADADGRDHQVRVELKRGEEVIAEDVSPPFQITSRGVEAEAVTAISEESMTYLDEALAGLERLGQLESDLVSEPEGGDADEESREAGRLEFARLRNVTEENFVKAIELDPTNYHATYGVARLLNRTGDASRSSDVLRYLNETVQIKPDHSEALNDLGAAYIRNGDYERAAEYLERSLTSSPSPIGHYNLGLALLYLSRTAEAREHFQRALEEPSTVPPGDVYYYTVFSYLLEGREDQARTLYESNKDRIPDELRSDLESRL